MIGCFYNDFNVGWTLRRKGITKIMYILRREKIKDLQQELC